MHTDTSPWLRRFGSTRTAGAVEPTGPTVVCFPHAGGSASAFIALSRAVSSGIDLVAVQYPGRQDRISEPPPGSVEEYARLVAAALAPVAGRPLVLFGHSMGASIAFETALRLGAGGEGTGPLHLFASACPSPRVRRTGRPPLTDDAAVLDEVRRLGGTHAAVLDDPDLRAAFLPTLRSDFAVADAYHHTGEVPALSCPVTVLHGTSDPGVDETAARGWADVTTGPFALHRFDGGHFYLDDHVHAVAELVESGSRAAVT